MRRVDLPITGMTCAACARRIEKRLAKSYGVSTAGVNFATMRATVEYDPLRTGVSNLVEAVEEIGYHARDTTKDERSRPDAPPRSRRRA